MNKIEILNYTKKPLTVIGTNASYCYGTELKDENHARRIAEHCINSGHGRNLEFADVTLKITCSARMAREWYTHIGGSPTRVQASTRYITYKDFDYYVPEELNEEQKKAYKNLMEIIATSYQGFKEIGLENDITGYVLPLAMETTFIWKGNVRTLENMFNQRMCTRALNEYRQAMIELRAKLKDLDSEWSWLSSKLFVSKCTKSRTCVENNSKCLVKKAYERGVNNDK